MRPKSLFVGELPRFVLHPALIAITYVLSLALPNEVEAQSLVRPLIAATTFAIVLTTAGWITLRNRWDGALAATVTLAVILSLIPLLRTTEFFVKAFGAAGGTAALAVGLTGLLGGIAIVVRRARRQGRAVPRPPAGFLNAFAAILIVLSVVGNVGIGAPALLAMDGSPAGSHQVRATEQPPDIVIILLDGYPRADVLQRRFGINNQPFIDALERHGMDVDSGSRSNYTFTNLTLATMFQMRYLEDIGPVRDRIGSEQPHRGLLRDVANYGAAFATLRSASYEIITAPSGWLHASLASASDEILDHGGLTDLERTLLERTWLMDILDLIKPSAVAGTQRDRIVNQFNDAEAFAAEARDRPAFLFLHVPAPHLPLVLSADGDTRAMTSRSFEATTPEGMGLTQQEYEATWAAELSYLNTRVLAAIEMLQAAERPPVIIVMSDHGYAYQANPDDLQSRFGNMFAAYTPGAQGLLKPAPTPVNLMPRLFNHYLATDLPVAPDRYFLSPSDDRPLLLAEITDPERIPSAGTGTRDVAGRLAQ